MELSLFAVEPAPALAHVEADRIVGASAFLARSVGLCDRASDSRTQFYVTHATRSRDSGAVKGLASVTGAWTGYDAAPIHRGVVSWAE
jgi:hypothetical protein